MGINPIINSLSKTLINNNRQIQVSATSITDGDATDLLKYQVTITKPNSSVVIKRDYDSTFQSNPMTFSTLTFNASEFDEGINTITVNVMDNQGGTAQGILTVRKEPTVVKTLLQDGIKWKYISGNSFQVALTDYVNATIENKKNAFTTYGMGVNLVITPELNDLIENRGNFRVIVNQHDSLDPPSTLVSIAIKTPASKLTYNTGETIDITGLVVEGTYNDGYDNTTKIETITTSNITGFNSTSEVASQILTINVNGQTVTYEISIVKLIKYGIQWDANALSGVGQVKWIEEVT